MCLALLSHPDHVLLSLYIFKFYKLIFLIMRLKNFSFRFLILIMSFSSPFSLKLFRYSHSPWYSKNASAETYFCCRSFSSSSMIRLFSIYCRIRGLIFHISSAPFSLFFFFNILLNFRKSFFVITIRLWISLQIFRPLFKQFWN